jgi:hypothetical protein
MFIVILKQNTDDLPIESWGPFTTEEKAERFAESFMDDHGESFKDQMDCEIIGISGPDDYDRGDHCEWCSDDGN